MNSALDAAFLAPASGPLDPAVDVPAETSTDAVDDRHPAVDTGTIAWLLPEIASAFDAATSALRAFRAGAAGVDRLEVDLAPLRGARSHLHQAHGALELGEIAGVTKLTEAMEDLLATFEAAPERCDAIALDAIIGGCRAIVEYLEDLQGGAPQQPLHLYPSYRDLLGARGVDRIHPADLFLVDLDVRAPKGNAGTALANAGLQEQRSAFEQALLRYIRNDRDGAALSALSGAVAAIDESVAANAKQGHGQQRAFWWSTRALFEALANDGFAHAPAQQPHLKRLAGRINLQIRKLVDGSAAIAERLYIDVLFFVAVAAPVTPLVRDVQRRYRLVDAVPADYETQRYGRIDGTALRAARDAIAAAKGAWSAVVAGEVGHIRTFAKETGALLDAVGPIRRPGLVQVAQVVDGIATDLGFDPRQPSAGVGLDVATALLFLDGALERARFLDAAFDTRAALVVARVEASALGREHPVQAADWLDRMSRKAEERLTVATFVGELQANLRNAEKVLDAFFRDPAERSGLPVAQAALAQVGGALALLGHDEVHQAIDRARETIEGFRQGDAAVDDGAFSELAQSLGAVGFYVDQIKRERIDTDAFHFDPSSGRFSADMARVPVAADHATALSIERVADGAAARPIDASAVDAFAVDAAAVPVTAEASEPAVGVLTLDAFDLPDEEPVAEPARASRAAPDEGPRYDPFAATDILFAATEVLGTDATLEDEIASRAADAHERLAELRRQPDDDAVRAQLVAAIDDVRRNAMLIDDRALYDEASALVNSLQDARRGPLGFASVDELADRVSDLVAHANRSAGIAPPVAPPLEPAMPVAAEANDDGVDAELLEIFLEEAGGVLADATASLRVLDADPVNTTATTNLRRGFHTLKGSGRMVGLTAFGDAAWSIEETLNDHIGSQRPASLDLRSLVAYAIRYLSDWADELQTSGSAARLPDALIEAARAVRDAARPASTASPMSGAAFFASPDAPGSDEATAPGEAGLTGDEFLRTEFAHRGTAPAEDAYFAATQVLGDHDEMPDLEFFGTQPTMRDGAAASHAAGGDADADRSAVEEPDFAALFGTTSSDAADTASAPVDASVGADDRASAEGFRYDAPVAPIEADAVGTAFALDFDEPVATDRRDSLLPVDSTTDFSAEPDADRTAAALPRAAEAEHVPVDATSASAPVSDEPSASRDDVATVGYPVPRPTRADDVRHIGPLTLSVALFNIYLTEADELLRVLTQDFAEWRHELDRYVSDGAMRAAHSLAGSSATVGLVAAHDLAAAIEEVLQQLWREPVEMRDDQVVLLQDAVESLRRMLHRFAAERIPDADPFRIAALVALRRDIAGEDAHDREATAVFADASSTVDAAAHPAVGAAAVLPFEPLDFGDAPSTVGASRLPAEATDAADVVDIESGPTAVSEVGSDDVREEALVQDGESGFFDGIGAADTLDIDEAIELAPLADEFDPEAIAELAAARSELPDAGPDPFDAITTIGMSESPFDADDVVDRWMTVDEDPEVRPFDKLERPIATPIDFSTPDAFGATDDGPVDAADAASGAANDALSPAEVAESPVDGSAHDADRFEEAALDEAALLHDLPVSDEGAPAEAVAAEAPAIEAPAIQAIGFDAEADADAAGTSGELDGTAPEMRAADDHDEAVVAEAVFDAPELRAAAEDSGVHEAAGADDVSGAGEAPATEDTTATLASPAVFDPFQSVPASDAASDDAPASPGATRSATEAFVPSAVADAAALAEAAPVARRTAVAAVPVDLPTVQDDIDPELLDVFVEEGGEILPQIGALLRGWQSNRSDATPARTLLRHLHTLKGSARMAGAMRLGEVAHDIEARVESAARLHEVPSALFDELLAAHDRSLELFDRLQSPAALPVADAADAVDAADGSDRSVTVEATPADASPVLSAAAPASVPDSARAAPAGAARTREPKQASQQAVRVNSDTLDRLVNLAGEVSISRARIENEILQIKGAMSDLGENVERLKSQLREIELQAEFQMQSQMQSQQAAGQEREKFDPLEFDRFTRFQELTRMMAESVNDVKTLQQHLQKSLDTAETDLASQRRMTRDLQQDLMRVRMVPFASIAERLYRVARRTAKEVDKRVNLDIRGGSVEIDRGVLERMAGPFEHLLRNHIVHGIESREARRAAGKDETGELLVEVRQEGNEIVLTFSDDGAGLDLDRIRRKGRELGLVDERDLTDAQAAELIFHPGFSTASEVTELAGRGVGMDVVRAEAVVLAGRVSVDFVPGKGTRFTINLPLTLAITQVVLVAVANRTYALPAVLVEQVQQLRPQPLADAYRAGQLEWAGAPVRLAFLGTLLGIDDSVPVAQRTSPVLILRSAGERIAIHVDEVVGNQEVVVKNLGPQLARMTGIAGATVLGSGEIVLILNPVQLAQMSHAASTSVETSPGVANDANDGATPAADVVAAPPVATGADLQTLPTVMVVDDSLTVRRVTQRLLSREGYQVVLAKDGVDALEQLQDFPPDVMLVDIEMPRMDGFDLTRNVRNDERYRHIPIIMITSRTAEKHRRHAAELGVDAYLGKPYQEDELLDLLTQHIAAKRGHPA